MDQRTRFLGLDVHKETIAAAVCEEIGGPESYGTIANEPAAIRKLVRTVGGKAIRLVAAYEAGPTGFVIQRQLARLGIGCVVAAPSLMGFGFYFRRTSEIAIRVAPKALRRMRGRIRVLTGRNWRIAMPERIRLLNRFVTGWCAYFALAETPSTFEAADGWLRRRLRQVRWSEWMRPRARARNLLALGIPEPKAYEWAYSRIGHWRMAGSAPLNRALPTAHWDHLGLAGFTSSWRRLRITW